MGTAFEGQVVLITGGARGQGRAHALAFAREGADIAFCDIAHQLDVVQYPLASEENLAETIRLVEALDRRCIGVKADVRDREALEKLATRTVSELGRIDVLCANAAISSFGTVDESTAELWDDTIAVNLTGVWNSVKAVLPQMLRQEYGRIIATSSSVARHPVPGLSAYMAAKTGVIALIKGLSLEYYNSGITANAVAPTMVGTEMVFNDAMCEVFLPDVENPTKDELIAAWAEFYKYGEPYLEPERITDGILFLASEAASKISGICLDIQAGWNAETPV